MTTLLVPDVRRGRGTGHLRRCLRLLEHLDGAVLLIPESPSESHRGREEFGELLSGIPRRLLVAGAPAHPDRVVFDMFELAEADVLKFGNAVTIGIDARGPGRLRCSYLFDILPRSSQGLHNSGGLEFLDLPSRREPSLDSRGRVLVTFGGEDSSLLTEKTVHVMANSVGIAPGLVTVVRPALREMGRMPRGIEVNEPYPDLSARLHQYEHVVCLFGLTALEARAAGCSVVTVNPTRYHDILARNAGIARAGVGRPSARKLRRAFSEERMSRPELNPSESAANGGTADRSAASVPPDSLDGKTESVRGAARLAAAISSLDPDHTGCPAHPRERGCAVWRDGERSFFVCPVCGITYQERFAADVESYGSSYFADEYERQYGKTYLEDFNTIRAMGLRRIGTIARMLGEPGEILDIGCAYGPFMAAARSRGFTPFGIDVSDEAASHVRSELKMPCFTGSVLEFNPEEVFGRTRFQAVSLWYVIEHFSDLAALMRRLAMWVKPGGILAISTPYARGVTGRTAGVRLYETNPRDHHTIWDWQSSRKILAEHGFRVRRIVSTGHHPERYRLVQRGLLPPAVAGFHSRVAGWGDTFEVYAEREHDD